MMGTDSEGRELMLFYKSFEEAINDIYEQNKETAAELYHAVVRYGIYGEIPQLTGIAGTLWKLMLPNIKAGRDKADAGSKGGKASKRNNPNGRKGKADPDTQEADTERFTPPTADEVEDYVLENGFLVDADEFVNYYAANGWMIGRNKMKDWRAVVWTWDRKGMEKSFKKKKEPERDPKLGVGEYRNAKGERTYGKSGIVVPEWAPPRPSEAYWWSEPSKAWFDGI